MSGVGHQRCCLVDLEQAEVRTALDRQQHAVGTLHRRLQQWTGHCLLGGGDRAVLSPRTTDSHQRAAGAGHHRLHVSEVEVDQPRRGDQVGDALDTGEQHLVGGPEGIHHADVAVTELQQPVVRDHDEGVALVAQLADAGLSLGGPALALERERPGHHADGQRTQLARDARHDWCPAGAGTAALTGGHEHHVGALEDLLDLLAVILGGLAADLGLRPGAETAGEFPADVELDVGVAHQQRLGVGVDGDELDPLEADLDHPVDGIDAAPADPDDLDDRQVVVRSCHRIGPLLQ